MWAIWKFLIDCVEKWNETSMIYFNYEFYLTQCVQIVISTYDQYENG